MLNCAPGAVAEEEVESAGGKEEGADCPRAWEVEEECGVDVREDGEGGGELEGGFGFYVGQLSLEGREGRTYS